MVVRLPSAAQYAPQVEKEARWLPKLAHALPLKIAQPLALGMPSADYPWKWGIYQWIEGHIATAARSDNLCELAACLASFLAALHLIDTSGGPVPGHHNFHRGGSLAVYDAEVQAALTVLKHEVDAARARRIWETALQSNWTRTPVWVHGDISPGNLLIVSGRLNAVIDFGLLAIGDPACDLSIAWTFFRPASRRAFHQALRLDRQTWERARGWTLWKALIVAAKLAATNAVEMQHPIELVREVLADDAGI